MRTRLPSLAASLALLLLLAGCPPGDTITVGPNTYLPASAEPYGVDRVVIGASIADVRSALGAPKEEMGPADSLFMRFDAGLEDRTGVTSRDGVVFQVSGSTFTRGDVVLVRTGATEEEVVAALGQGWVHEQRASTMAGGGGMINVPTGSKLVGRQLRYRDGEVTFYLWIRDGAVQSVRSQRGWPRHEPEPRRP